MASDETVFQAVSAMCEAFGRKPTEATFSVYRMGLDGLTDVQVAMACKIAATTQEFMPPPAVLRKLVGCGVQSDEDRAGIAWDHASKAVGNLGAYAHVDFDDRTVNATIRSLGGWPSFCARFVGPEAEKWLRIEFVKIYGTHSRMGVTEESGAVLGGLSTGRVGPCGEELPPLIATVRTGLERPQQERQYDRITHKATPVVTRLFKEVS